MTCREFEEALDAWLHDPSAESSVQMPARWRDHVETCPRCEGLSRDWLWLDRQFRDRPLLQPSAGFAKRVVEAALKAGLPNAPVRRSSAPALAAGWSCVLAASLLLAAMNGLMFAPPAGVDGRSADQSDRMATTLPPELNEGDAVALVRDLAETLAFRRETSIAPSPAAEVSTVEPPRREEFPELGFRRALRDSTGNLLTVGRELGASIQPITRSAVDAFDFLWQDLGEQEEPNT